MLDRIFDTIEAVLYWFRFWVVVDQYERGVVLTFGRYRGRTLEPGLAFVWPLGIDQVLVDNVVRAPLSLPAQSLVTADGVRIMVSPLATWRIIDIVAVTIHNEGAEHVVAEIVQATVARYIRRTNCDIIITDKFVRRLRDAVRRRCKELGVEIIDFELADLVTNSKTLRLIND